MAVKGKTNNPNGRPKGSKNKVDQDIRFAFEAMLRRNAAKIDQFVDEVYEEHGAKEVLNQLSVFAEYVLPKLARVEQQMLDKDGAPANASVEVKLVKDTD